MPKQIRDPAEKDRGEARELLALPARAVLDQDP